MPTQLRFLKEKLQQKYIWRRILLERMTEPLHLNVAASLVWMFGSFRAKVAFDLVLRHHHAYGILEAADQAKRLGHDQVTLLEFGVAVGTGLLNMAEVADRVTDCTGVAFQIYGFDTGTGMPPPLSFRDHPELFQAGDFLMDPVALRQKLPSNAHLVLGNIASTIPQWLSVHDAVAPIGFVSIDVDYYSSSRDALGALTGPAEHYLPRTWIYLDDIENASNNSYAGELLAVREFTEHHEFRKIEKHPFLESTRIFQRAPWVGHMHTLHVLDHPTRTTLDQNRPALVLANPYLSDGA